MNPRLLPVLMLIAACGLAAPPAAAHDSPEALQAAFVDALRANDPQALADCYAADAVNFPVAVMIGHGPASVARDWRAFFADWRVLDVALTEQRMVREGDLAVAWGLFTIRAAPVGGGEAVDLRGRYLDAARPVDGRWLYIVDHASMPTEG